MPLRPVIRRYFDPEIFERVRADFDFLPEALSYAGYDLDVSIRENYFNLYCRGNSAAKIEPLKTQCDIYRVTINKQFVSSALEPRFSRIKPPKSRSTTNLVWQLNRNELRSFFQVRNLQAVCAEIKKTNYSEELAFEQALIFDNADDKNRIIIDRQIRDHASKHRADLLELTRANDGTYTLTVLEVKLGINADLKEAVGAQLRKYVDHITVHFEDYQKTYQHNYQQKRDWGFLNGGFPEHMEIRKPVRGQVVVLGYVKTAAQAVTALEGKYPDLSVVRIGLRFPPTR